MIRKRVVVEGRVQGVGFRASCAQQARAAGAGGMVHNLDDGGVEAVFEGIPSVVDALVTWCEHGPRFAHVRNVVVTSEEPRGETSFRVS
ncbi:MAG TPA: acylphosphatase [Acidimicrobiia bacterium]